jgi:hypothetical protein
VHDPYPLREGIAFRAVRTRSTGELRRRATRMGTPALLASCGFAVSRDTVSEEGVPSFASENCTVYLHTFIECLVLTFAARRVGFRRQIHQLLQERRVLAEEKAVGNKRLDGGHGTTVLR